MKVQIIPSRICGEVEAPPSKSMAHRLLICAGLSGGESIIRHVDLSEDVTATLACLKSLGVDSEYSNGTVIIYGVKPQDLVPLMPLPCNECGSTLRFMIPICLLTGKPAELTGSEKLLSRPLSIYEDLCRDHHMSYENDGHSVKICGKLESGEYVLPGDVSSQFVTGLLLALATTENGGTIRLTGQIESRSYILMTIAAMRYYGVTVRWEDDSTLVIPGHQSYIPGEVTVEGDYSNAAFFEALNLLGGYVRVSGLTDDSLQGDRLYRKYFQELNVGNPVISVADCPDLAPVLMTVATYLNGAVFTNTRRLKMKESDRGHVMAEELAKFGARIDVKENVIEVHKSDLHAPYEPLDGHNDHRIVMSLAVLLTQYGGTINGAEAVKKSLPGFFDMLQSVGAEVEIETD